MVDIQQRELKQSAKCTKSEENRGTMSKCSKHPNCDHGVCGGCVEELEMALEELEGARSKEAERADILELRNKSLYRAGLQMLGELTKLKGEGKGSFCIPLKEIEEMLKETEE